MDFKEFYQQCGLSEYPFNTFTTEDEAKANELFIEPVDYTLIKDGYKNRRTIIMSGNRGTGKTAIVYDLIRNSPSDSLICYIDDYSSINVNSTLQEFYELIAKNLVNTLFEKSINRQNYIKKLSKEDKIFFSFLVDKFVTPITKQLVYEKIEQIQLSKFKRFVNKSSSFIQLALNYGLTATIKMINNVIAVHFYMLPSVNEDEIKSILPTIKFTSDSHFIDEETSYSFILKICQLIIKLGFLNTIIFLDKIDEDTRFESDSDIIANFVKPILTDNKLLLNPSIQLITSIWAVPFSNIKASVRTQKYYCPELIWQQRDLIAAFNQRLKIFGANSCLNFNSIFGEDVIEQQKEEIIKLANHNPRDLWHIFKNLFYQQFLIDETAMTISSSAVSNGLNEFVKSFNYFEYYPRKKGARSSSMDIYKYINHLLKLPSHDFTSNQLNESGVGSSTNNYIAGMQSIGLIRRTDIKRNNGVVFEIIDPKVTYAMEKQIKITR